MHRCTATPHSHLGHPWIDEAIVVARKHPRVFLAVSALVSRPWQLYMGLISAREYGVWHKLLFGSDFPFFTPGQTAETLRALARMTPPTPLPRIETDWIEDLIERNSLRVVRIE